MVFRPFKLRLRCVSDNIRGNLVPSFWLLLTTCAIAQPSLIFDPLLPYLHCTTPPLPPTVMDKAIDLRSKCGHFRILVIGRANAGKTTLLKKVCNSVDDLEIFSRSGEKVRKTSHLRTRRFHSFNPTIINCSSIPPWCRSHQRHQS